ncbi:murein hydrolase activator EnvC family protein [Pseudaestuariivita atlantica]|uniref:Peptidase M23B n=1 Tax=Pseudaestuariivita atlantica TaxID=1317121 RepID=A0A0L1JQZ5_9RHOB|nr:peptidoglycan DD-metalloendopeptidase family protein [Pseudaestuariivita atlantica]KNG93828.1 peptidase M23B [Pseudaestuariivita atlantica]
MRLGWALCLWLGVGLGFGGPAVAQEAEEIAAAATRAADRLSEATDALEAAKGARDRVRALTGAVQSYEAGLAALRDGLRAATIEERRLALKLDAQRAELAQLLGVLQSMGDNARPTALLHPSGALGTARAGMLVSDVVPALDARAQAVAADLTRVRDMRAVRQKAAADLQAGLAQVQEARVALSQALADRVDLPRRFIEDPARTAALLAATDTLDAFATQIRSVARNEVPGSLPSVLHRKGRLPMPVQGVILRRAGEADAAGITRPGIVMATRPQALVTTPVAATIRYRGPLLDYGLVMILEPQADLMFVLAGMEVVYGETGEVVPAGTPVGRMGGTPADLSSQGREGAGTDRTETLYIEVREGQSPVDPQTWFAQDKG